VPSPALSLAHLPDGCVYRGSEVALADGGEESVDSASEVCGKSVTGRPQAGAGWVR